MKIKITLLALTLTLLVLSNNATAQTVTDKDGNVYNTVNIGTQEWMKENLRVTQLNEGTVIPSITSASVWATLTTPAFSTYNNTTNVDSIKTYGRYYNWHTVNTANLCPTNWHIPSKSEWTVLTTYLGGPSISGSKLKEAGTLHWVSPNTDATNESGFTALPAGSRNSSGVYGFMGSATAFWSSTSEDASTASGQFLSTSNGQCFYENKNKVIGYPVRCVSNLSVGIENEIIPSNFKLYPNPSNGKFTVECENIHNDIFIEIYNTIGEKISQQQNIKEIDLLNSPKGIYFVKVNDGNKFYTSKIVVQ